MLKEKTPVQEFLQKFRSRKHELTVLHRRRQLLPYYVEELESPKKHLASVERGFWENVAQHCLIAATITDVLADKLGLPEGTRSLLNTAAWMHDSGKKTERMWQLEIDTNGQTILEETGQTVEEAKKSALKGVGAMEEWENAEAGFQPKVSRIAKSNIPTLQQFLNGHSSLEEKIMWLADACLTGTRIDAIEERFDNLEIDPKNGELNIAFSNSYRDYYNGLSLYEVQRKLGERYVQEISLLLGIEETEFFNWLRDQVNERIETKRLPLIRNRFIFAQSTPRLS